MTNLLILPSTLFLTVLIAIGLVFFVRASVKDRTETRIWLLPQTETQVLEAVTQYLEGRAYRLDQVDREQGQVVFKGFVRASGALAIFLSVLAAVGALCMGLVLSVQFPTIGYGGLSMVLMAPLAGWFYRRNAQRTEQVILAVQSLEAHQQTELRVTAHRDEIKALQTTLQYPAPDH
ncbi:MAG: cofactor assembly of complex C subunit B [Thermosynechococcaceae cyanobacterium]